MDSCIDHVCRVGVLLAAVTWFRRVAAVVSSVQCIGVGSQDFVRSFCSMFMQEATLKDSVGDVVLMVEISVLTITRMPILSL